MPDATTPAQPQPAAQAPSGAGAGQPPFGSSPATAPTQNQGYQAQGLAGLSMVVKGLEKLVPLIGATSPVGQDVLESIKRLAKHIPPGTVSPAAEQNQMQRMMLAQAQMQGMRPQIPPQIQGAPQAQPPAARAA